jgi:hypothetical protein
MDNTTLFHFLEKALQSTYATLGVNAVQETKNGFKKLRFAEGDLSYVDSYSGFFRSRGYEVVYRKDSPIWMCSYGGGMVADQRSRTIQTFQFLKKVFLADKCGFQSVRGPHAFSDGDWHYSYTQNGGIDELFGEEEIYYKTMRMFYHRVIGGYIVHEGP